MRMGSGICWVWLLVSVSLAPGAEKERLVSGSGSLTEIIYAVGAGDELVAVDTTSVYPEAAAAKPKIGYARALSSEGILSMQPDLFLITDEAGPTAVVDQLRGAGLPMVVVEEQHSVEGVRNKIRQVAEAVNRSEAGRELLDEFDRQMEKVETLRAEAPEATALFLFGAGGGSPMAAGQKTGGNAVLELAGFKNVMNGYEGYKPVSAEAIVAKNPAWLVTTSGTVDGAGGLDAMLNEPGLAATVAAEKGQVIVVNDSMLLNFGPRLPKALLALLKPRVEK